MIPKEIKIINRRFKMVEFEDERDVNPDKDRHLSGTIRFKEGEIRYCRYENKQLVDQIILHEIIHGLLDILAESELSSKEDIVEKLALGFHCLLQDNDFSWIKE